MHDVVTHRMSLIVLQAGALQVTAGDELTRRAAEDVRVNGCQALAELRDLVRVLHDPAAGGGAHEAEAQASGPDLAPLVAASESVGMHVDLVEHGNPARTSPVIGRTAHRVVQEALTNVRKHAPGARARVHVHYHTDGMRLVVDNTTPARPIDPALSATGGGTGLAGLHRRVDLVGGVLHTGPTPEGGFRVEATLPASPERS
jgi:signal transduction histidine kinase